MHRMHQSDLTPLNLQIDKDFAITCFIIPLILTQSVLVMNNKTVQSHTVFTMLLFVFPMNKTRFSAVR